jgi:hypothetical protein
MIKARLLLPLAMLLAASCAGPYIRREPARDEEFRREELVEAARGLIGAKDLTSLNRHFRNDCSGFVIGLYRMMGYQVKIPPGRGDRPLSERLFLAMQDRGHTYREYQPLPGEAVFFKNTTQTSYDRITHIGLVEEVASDGTVSIIHYGSGSVNRIRMNLNHPYREKDGRGRVINSYLRRDDAGRGKGNILTGALFWSYGDLYGYAVSERAR